MGVYRFDVDAFGGQVGGDPSGCLQRISGDPDDGDAPELLEERQKGVGRRVARYRALGQKVAKTL
jgi:hypothetical protein